MLCDSPLSHFVERGSLRITNHDGSDTRIDSSVDHFSYWLDQFVPKADIPTKENIDLLQIFFSHFFKALYPAFRRDAIEFRYGIEVGKNGGICIHRDDF